MSPALYLRGVILLGEWTLIATVLLLLARLSTSLVRRNAALRHLIWLTTFSSLLIIPALLAVMPARFVVELPAPLLAGPVSAGADASGPLVGNVLTSAVSTPADRPAQLPVALLALWLAGVGVVTIMGVAAGYGIAKNRRHSVAHEFDELDLRQLALKVGLKRACALRVSSAPSPAAAMTWGFLRPTILLPENSRLWPKDRLKAVLLHELAHVRRCDSLSQWLAFAVCALYWFHPAVWRFAGMMRAEAELAADDAVLLSGMKPSTYAAELLRFAAELGQRGPRIAYSGVSFMRQSRIAARVESILNVDHKERGVTPKQVLFALAAGVVTILFIVLLRPSISVASPARAASLSAVAPSQSLAHPSAQSATSREYNPAHASLPPPVRAKAQATKHCSKKTAAAKARARLLPDRSTG